MESIKRSSATLFLVAIILGCAPDGDTPAGCRGEPFILNDPQKQAKILKQLDEDGVPYWQDNEEYIHYLLNDHAKVLGMRREVEYGKELKPEVYESRILFSDLQREEYERRFIEKGIPYKIGQHAGKDFIEWGQVYGPQVDKIIQNIAFESMDCK